LTELMDGSIRVESTYQKGSTFTAEMIQEPVDDTPIGDYTEHLREAQIQNEVFRPDLIAPRAEILIVDDNEMNLEVITELLRETRMKITTALSGQECLSMLEQKQYDLIFLDQMMPGMSGTKTIQVMRERHLCDETPVIALTFCLRRKRSKRKHCRKKRNGKNRTLPSRQSLLSVIRQRN